MFFVAHLVKLSVKSPRGIRVDCKRQHDVTTAIVAEPVSPTATAD